jgi:hypothetical protein
VAGNRRSFLEAGWRRFPTVQCLIRSLATTRRWTAATAAPIPGRERTYWASNADCSLVAFDLSVAENSQQQRNAIVKIAGDR